MNFNIEETIVKLDLNAPATKDAIEVFERSSGFELPEEYVEFLLRTNGADGFIGDNYVIFWAVEELIDLNKAYEVDEYKRGLFLFGSDGSGEAFAFDRRSLPIKIVTISFISIDLEDAIKLCSNFFDFLKILNKNLMPFQQNSCG